MPIWAMYLSVPAGLATSSRATDRQRACILPGQVQLAASQDSSLDGRAWRPALYMAGPALCMEGPEAQLLIGPVSQLSAVWCRLICDL